MADIFISYSSKDRKNADVLVEHLRSTGFSVWIDQSGIDIAASWSKEIAVALESCKAMVLLLSESSLSSKNVAKELSVAAELDKHIIPVEVEPVRLSGDFLYHLSGLQRTNIKNVETIRSALTRIGITVTDSPSASGRNDLPDDSPDSGLLRLAVLPFEDLSPSHDNEWFSDGLTDELISTMNKIERMFVIDKQTSRDYKHRTMKASNIGRELGVRFIVRGSVRKAGENIRIQADLVDTLTGVTLWDEKFPGSMENIFDIQERVAKEIAAGMQLKLSPADEVKIEEKITKNTVAYELYLRAASIGDRITKKDYWQAIQLFDNVIEIDPGIYAAHCSQANCLINYYKKFDHNPSYLEKAKERLEQAKVLKPDYPALYATLGLLYEALGKPSEAVAAAEHAVELDPKEGRVYFLLGFLLSELNRSSESTAAYEKALELKPDILTAHYNCALMYDRAGEREKSEYAATRGIPYYQRHLARHPDDSSYQISYAFLLDMAGLHKESLEQVAAILALPEIDGSVLYDAACLNIRNGNKDEGLRLLCRSIEAGGRHTELFLTDPDLDPLRGMPEFEELVKKLSEL